MLIHSIKLGHTGERMQPQEREYARSGLVPPLAVERRAHLELDSVRHTALLAHRPASACQGGNPLRHPHVPLVPANGPLTTSDVPRPAA